eukprot:TRINITY_DN4666_c0_g5_i1.p1 TRINITY_DN4666_c0_g5~~TRINITY_DN4666_c0_g5_i1.p1  ORF type:complete len:223 (+),score=83.36 TRINITY_DN4666_c0_g5_i1:82-669(+)
MAPKKAPEPEPELSPEEEEERRRLLEELHKKHAAQCRQIEQKETGGRRLVEEMQEVARRFLDNDKRLARAPAPPPPPERHYVHVKVLAGNRALPCETLTLVCGKEDTVEQLKQKIFDTRATVRIPPENQRLTHRGKELTEGPLRENGVGPESALHVHVVGKVTQRFEVPPVRYGRPLPTRAPAKVEEVPVAKKKK